MTSNLTPTPNLTPASLASQSQPSSLAQAQHTAASVEAGIMKFLTPTTQALVGVAQVIGTPNEDTLMKTLGSISAVTQVAASINNPTVQTYAGLAAVIEQLVSDGIGTVEGATLPAAIVPNAHPSLQLKWFHPNIAKQEEALAAAQTAGADAVKPAVK